VRGAAEREAVGLSVSESHRGEPVSPGSGTRCVFAAPRPRLRSHSHDMVSQRAVAMSIDALSRSIEQSFELDATSLTRSMDALSKSIEQSIDLLQAATPPVTDKQTVWEAGPGQERDVFETQRAEVQGTEAAWMEQGGVELGGGSEGVEQRGAAEGGVTDNAVDLEILRESISALRDELNDVTMTLPSLGKTGDDSAVDSGQDSSGRDEDSEDWEEEDDGGVKLRLLSAQEAKTVPAHVPVIRNHPRQPTPRGGGEESNESSGVESDGDDDDDEVDCPTLPPWMSLLHASVVRAGNGGAEQRLRAAEWAEQFAELSPSGSTSLSCSHEFARDPWDDVNSALAKLPDRDSLALIRHALCQQIPPDLRPERQSVPNPAIDTPRTVERTTLHLQLAGLIACGKDVLRQGRG